MSDVYIVGIDMIRFGRYPEKTVPGLAAEAALLEAHGGAGGGVLDGEGAVGVDAERDLAAPVALAAAAPGNPKVQQAAQSIAAGFSTLVNVAEIEKLYSQGKHEEALGNFIGGVTSKLKSAMDVGDLKGAMAKVDPKKRQELQRAERVLYNDITDLELKHPGAPQRANALTDVPRSRDYPVLNRGEATNKGPIVPRRFLEILSPDPKNRPEWHEGSGRLQLAMAIADPKNPMTARVLVNRIWQQHFGAGFVATPDDLGNMSSPPTQDRKSVV
mgnify:CR=1 FL=1